MWAARHEKKGVVPDLIGDRCRTAPPPLTRIFELCILQTIEIIRPTAVLTGRQFNSLLGNMATSSITHNFVFDAESTQRFVDQLEAAERDAQKPIPQIARFVTDPKEILAFMSKQESNG